MTVLISCLPLMLSAGRAQAFLRKISVYIKNSSDLRLHPRIPRDSERSACERMNDRVLNNYHLQDLKIRGNDHFSFWTMIIGICIHLDAWYKMSSIAKQTAWSVYKSNIGSESTNHFQTLGIVRPFFADAHYPFCHCYSLLSVIYIQSAKSLLFVYSFRDYSYWLRIRCSWRALQFKWNAACCNLFNSPLMHLHSI